jgi:hypothetical protein
MNASKVAALEFILLLAPAPFIIWLALWIAARRSINLRPLIPWLRVLRWLGWGAGLMFGFAWLATDRFVWITYECALIGFSAGLGIPEGWVKRRFAPELLEHGPPDEWWPSKRE